MHSKGIGSHFYTCHGAERPLRMITKLNFFYIDFQVLIAITGIYSLFQECAPYSVLSSTTMQVK